MRALHGQGALIGEEVSVHDDARLVRSQELGLAVAERLGGGSAVLLRGNGAVTVGATVGEAVARMWVLEASAGINLGRPTVARSTTKSMPPGRRSHPRSSSASGSTYTERSEHDHHRSRPHSGRPHDRRRRGRDALPRRRHGPAVLLLHGSGPGVSAWANWRLVIPELAESLRVIAPDQIGFNQTLPPPGVRYGRELWTAHALG
jgi:hypothetical protein